MANLTLAPETVSHVLPSKFWGVGHSTFRGNNDGPVAAYQQIVNALDMEVFRAHFWGIGTNQSDPINASGLKVLALTMGPAVEHIVQWNIRPNPWPRANVTTYNPVNNYPNLIQTAGNNGSPANLAAAINDWIDAGLAVTHAEPYNEPSNNFANDDGDAGERWFYQSGTGRTPADEYCERWAAIYQKPMYQAAKPALHDASVKIANSVLAGASMDYIDNLAKDHMDPRRITSSPRSDTNASFTDAYSCHPYIDGSQGGLNSMVYTADPTGAKAALTAWANQFRTYLAGLGASSLPLIFTECAWFEGGSLGALTDIEYAVVCARNQARWKLDKYIYHAVDTTNADMVIMRNLGTGAYYRTWRYRAMQQMVAKFIGKGSVVDSGYKQQLFDDDTFSWDIAPGNTPATTYNNAVPRLQVAAGLNAAGDTIGLLVANIDLATAEALNVNIGAVTTAAISYTKLPAGQTYTLGQDIGDLPTGTISSAGQSSFSQTIGAGEAWLFEIPIDVAIPICTVAPVITGTPEVGQTLTCSQGTWDNPPVWPWGYGFQWQWSEHGDNVWTDVGDTTHSTFLITATYAGRDLRCHVSADNQAGRGWAYSNTIWVEGDYPGDVPAANAIASAVVPLLFNLSGGAVSIRVRGN